MTGLTEAEIRADPDLMAMVRMAERISTASGYEDFLPDKVGLVLDALTMFLSPLLTFIPVEAREHALDVWIENLKGIGRMHDKRGQTRRGDA